MTRSERRRREREEKKKTVTYNFTKEQLEEFAKDKIVKMKQEATDDAVNKAMILMLSLPLEVLMDHYWPKTYASKIPEFTKHVLDYFRMWQDGELDINKLKEDLWEYGGVRLEETEG